MPFIRLQENLPLVYEENSRDFQLLGRLYDCVINGVKNDIDNLIYINNPDYCYSNILELLKTKVGFFTSKHFSDRELRHTLKVFSILLKNKGAKEGYSELSKKSFEKYSFSSWESLNIFFRFIRDLQERVLLTSRFFSSISTFDIS